MVRIVSLLLISLLAFAGCSKKGKVHQLRNDETSGYSIQLKTLSQNDSTLKGFSSSFSAGMRAFELLKKGVIRDYSITLNGMPVYDEFSTIFFVSKYGRQPAVFNYNLKTGNYKMFWSNPKEMVVELNSSKDGKTVFFLTASDYGRKTIFPFINNVKVYRIDLLSLKVEKLKDLGNGIQLFTNWETPGTFKVTFNAFDPKKSTFVVQTRLVFNSNGRLLNNEKVTYDIVKEKYPVPEISSSDIASSGNKFDLVVSKDNKQNILTVVDSIKARKIIYSTSDIINSVEWWNNGNCFIFSTYDVTPRNTTLRTLNPQTSSLYIYSVSEGKILQNWKGGGYKNFLLRGDLLFFDDGFNDNSKILIYDLADNKMINTLAIRGGCGIRNIPIIPY